MLAGANAYQGIKRTETQQTGKKGNKGDIFYNRLRHPAEIMG